MYKYINTQIHKGTNTQIHKYTNTNSLDADVFLTSHGASGNYRIAEIHIYCVADMECTGPE